VPSILETNALGAWSRFIEAHTEEVALAKHLFQAAEDLLRLVSADDTPKRILTTIAMSILQDFDEVLAMWALGFGGGATKLVRPLYEKALTFSYLAAHPEETADFVDYSSVHWNKIMLEGDVASEEGVNWIPEEERVTIAENYAAVRDRFRTTDCRRCGTLKPMGSWTKKSGPELAAAVHPAMRKMYFNGFLSPTMVIHPTFTAMATQVRIVDGVFTFNREVLAEDNAVAFGVATAALVATIHAMNDFFQLGQDETVGEAIRHFAAMGTGRA